MFIALLSQLLYCCKKLVILPSSKNPSASVDSPVPLRLPVGRFECHLPRKSSCGIPYAPQTPLSLVTSMFLACRAATIVALPRSSHTYPPPPVSLSSSPNVNPKRGFTTTKCLFCFSFGCCVSKFRQNLFSTILELIGFRESIGCYNLNYIWKKLTFGLF